MRHVDQTEALIDLYINGDATPEERASLARLVEADSGIAVQIYRQAEQRQLVVECMNVADGVAAGSVATSRRVRTGKPGGVGSSRSVRHRWGAWVAVAACLAIIVGAHLINVRQKGQFVDVLVAHIQETAPNVKVIRGADSRVTAAIVGMALFPGDRIEAKKDEKVVFGYQGEETVVTVGGGNRETTLVIGTADTGKRLHLEKGIIAASVTPQPADRRMKIITRHAEVEIMGTKLTMTVERDRTHLNVSEGLVRLKRLPDGETIEVAAGYSAVAGEDLALKASPGSTKYVDGSIIFQDDFEGDMLHWNIVIVDSKDGKYRAAGSAAERERVGIEKAVRDGTATRCLVVDVSGIEGVSMGIEPKGRTLPLPYVLEWDMRHETLGCSSTVVCPDVTNYRRLYDNPGAQRVRVRRWYRRRVECVPVVDAEWGDVRELTMYLNGKLIGRMLVQSDTGSFILEVSSGKVTIDNVIVRELVSVESTK